jgi:putative ABC transport system permease protein
MRILEDLRFGLRILKSAPRFAAVAILTLGLGIGLNSAVFSVVNATILNPLPWSEGHRIVVLRALELRKSKVPRALSPDQFLDLQSQLRTFEGMIGISGWSATLTKASRAEPIVGAKVTEQALQLTGIQPALGRAFQRADFEPGAESVIVLSDDLWRSQLAADPSIVGKTVRIDGAERRVIGVLDRNDWFPWPNAQALVPVHWKPAEFGRRERFVGALGVLRRGETIRAAQAEIDVAMARLAERYPDTDAGWTIRLEPAQQSVLGRAERVSLWLLMIAVGLVLLTACGNVANLLLARATERRKEIALRAAIGAKSGQITAQLVAESVVLALAAIPLAIMITALAIELFRGLVPASSAYVQKFFRLDQQIFLFTLVTSLTTVLFFGMVPAIQAARTDVASILKEGGGRGATRSGGRRMRAALAIGQIAMAFAMLNASWFVIDNFRKQSTFDPGFDIGNLLVGRVELSDARYPDETAWRNFHQELLTRLADVPGIRSAGTTNEAPFGFDGVVQEFSIDGRPPAQRGDSPEAVFANVSRDGLRTLGVRLIAGRSFDERDGESTAPVALVNESLVQRYFVGGDVVGERIETPAGRRFEIVGVVQDIDEGGVVGGGKRPRVYVLFDQWPWHVMMVLLRTSQAPMSLGGSVQDVLRSMDPELTLSDLTSMDKRVERSLWQARFFTTVMSLFSGVAIALAAIGVYGVINYSSSLRMHEFGIRAALGAEPRVLAGLVIREAMPLAGFGVVLGVGLSMAGRRLLSTALGGSDVTSLATYLSTALTLAALAVAASALPSLRAARVEPAALLRLE